MSPLGLFLNGVNYWFLYLRGSVQYRYMWRCSHWSQGIVETCRVAAISCHCAKYIKRLETLKNIIVYVSHENSQFKAGLLLYQFSDV